MFGRQKQNPHRGQSDPQKQSHLSAHRSPPCVQIGAASAPANPPTWPHQRKFSRNRTTQWMGWKDHLPMMIDAKLCAHFAEVCLRAAEQEDDPKHRAMLLKLAKKWSNDAERELRSIDAIDTAE